MNLTEFLLARITEDEADIKAEASDEVRYYYPDMTEPEFSAEVAEYIKNDWARDVAEADAKREVIAECRAAIEREDAAGRGGTSVLWGVCMNILRHMAMPYADHPDYDEAWRV